MIGPNYMLPGAPGKRYVCRFFLWSSFSQPYIHFPSALCMLRTGPPCLVSLSRSLVIHYFLTSLCGTLCSADISFTNVPDCRCSFRYECMMGEMQVINRLAASKPTSPMTSGECPSLYVPVMCSSIFKRENQLCHLCHRERVYLCALSLSLPFTLAVIVTCVEYR